MNVEAYILQALQQSVTAAVAASSSPDLKIKYITAKPFVVPNDQKYLECVQIPNNITNQFWGNERTYRGAFRLLLHWPINGGDVYTPMNLLASIAGYFTKDRVLVNAPAHVKIYDIPDFGGHIVNGQEIIFPVTLLYRDFQP